MCPACTAKKFTSNVLCLFLLFLMFTIENRTRRGNRLSNVYSNLTIKPIHRSLSVSKTIKYVLIVTLNVFHSNQPKQPFFFRAIFCCLLNFMRNITIYVFLASFQKARKIGNDKKKEEMNQYVIIFCHVFCVIRHKRPQFCVLHFSASPFLNGFFFCCRLCLSLRIEIDMLLLFDWCCCFQINNTYNTFIFAIC